MVETNEVSAGSTGLPPRCGSEADDAPSRQSPPRWDTPPLASHTAEEDGDVSAQRPGRFGTRRGSRRKRRIHRQQSRGDSPLPQTPSRDESDDRPWNWAKPCRDDSPTRRSPDSSEHDFRKRDIDSNTEIGSKKNEPKLAGLAKPGEEETILYHSPPSCSTRSSTLSVPGAFAINRSWGTDTETSSNSGWGHLLGAMGGDDPVTQTELPERVISGHLVEASLVETPSHERSISRSDIEALTESNSGSFLDLVEASTLSKTIVLVTKKKLMVIPLVIIVVSCAIVMGTLIAATSKRSKTLPELPPSQAPTAMELSDFVDMFLPPQTQEALLDPESPQTQALSWLDSGNAVAMFDKDRKLQRFALATLYYATAGAYAWKNSHDWITEVSECAWYSKSAPTIVCDDEDSKYRVLDLHELSLNGPLPGEVNLLTNLVSLTLQGNGLTGTFPSLEQLTSLEYIDLSESWFTGQLPLSLASLTELRTANFHTNSLTGELPVELFHAWNQTRRVDLGWNRLRGTIPTEISSMDQLSFLGLDYNAFTGTIPEALCSLTRLQILWLASNSLTGTIPSCLGNLQSLRQVTLEENLLTGSVPDHLCQLQEETGMVISIDCELVSCGDICECECETSSPSEVPSRAPTVSDVPSAVPAQVPSLAVDDDNSIGGSANASDAPSADIFLGRYEP